MNNATAIKLASARDAIRLAAEVNTPDPELTDALRRLCIARARRMFREAEQMERTSR